MTVEAPRVLNKRWIMEPITEEIGIYIGRGSKWGNSYKIGGRYLINGHFTPPLTRQDAIRLYIDNFPDSLRAELHELKGKNLICYCAPQPCHGDWLFQEANR